MKTEFNFKNPGKSFKGFCRPEILTYRDFSFINLNCSLEKFISNFISAMTNESLINSFYSNSPQSKKALKHVSFKAFQELENRFELSTC
jgi:hypothetical protein